jgi:ACS family tartrate transporter-like MFS transporter
MNNAASLTHAGLSAMDAATPADERALFAKISRRLMPLLFILYVVSYLDRMNVSFAGLQLRRDLESIGLGAKAFGIGSGIFFLGYFLFEIPSNLILQRVGARRWIARIMFTWGVIATAMMFVRGPRSFYVLRFLLGVAEAGFFPGVILYLTYWFPAPRRARAVAVFMTATAASGVFGALVSTAILSLDGRLGLHGWQWVFLLEGLPALALAFVVLRLLPNAPQDAMWLSEAERLTLDRCLASDHHTLVHRTSGLLAAFTRPRVWLLTAVYFTIALGMYCVSFWLPQLIAAAWPGHADRQVTLVTGGPYAVAAGAMILVGRSSDRTGERRLHVSLALLAAAGGAAASAAFHSPLIALLAFSLVTIGIWSAIGPFWGIPPAFLAGTAAAGGIALINSFGNLGGFLGPYIFGAIKQRTGSFTAAFWILAGILTLGAGLAYCVRPEIRNPPATDI